MVPPLPVDLWITIARSKLNSYHRVENEYQTRSFAKSSKDWKHPFLAVLGLQVHPLIPLSWCFRHGEREKCLDTFRRSLESLEGWVISMASAFEADLGLRGINCTVSTNQRLLMADVAEQLAEHCY